MNELVRLELVRESLVAVVNEMRANIIHASYSSIIYEGHDFSCALMSADGRQVAQSLDDHPLHIFPVPYSTREVVAAFEGDIHEGDIFFHNDPYTGGTHLNDVLMLYPVFHDGRLVMFAAARCHWGDVGGMTPGSLSGRVNEIIQEGLRVVPTRIAERGRMNEAFLSLLFNNMRTPAERRGDFNTMLGTCRKAAEHIERLFQRFGEGLLDDVETLFQKSEEVMRARIAGCPDGVYLSEGYIESDGHNAEPLAVRLKLTIAGDQISADFTGTSAQTNGPTNVGPAMAMNAVGTVVKSFLDPKTPINHGSFMPIEVIAPVGSFINARDPAPCGGMVECKALMDSVVAAAMGQAVPEMMIGDNKGGGNHVYISGPNEDREGIYLFYEWPAGGTGATRGLDGNNGQRYFTEGDFNSINSAEVVESAFPLRVECCELRQGGCGDGSQRGGFGIRREVRILGQRGVLSVLSEKNMIPPYGVDGGGNGSANRYTVVRDGEVIEPSPVPGKVSGFPLHQGDIVRIETSGGGGYGDPLQRDPEAVRLDVRRGYLAAEEARTRYGVILTRDGTVDDVASAALRESLAADRKRMHVQGLNEELFQGARRRLRLSEGAAGRLGISAGDLVEISSGRGVALRGWAEIVADEADDVVSVGPSGLALMGLEAGAAVELRPVDPGMRR
ncbi:MAG: hydantoinase B/oxoprolinase family protein [Alphaproteobacteria bacterium]|jgi:N-methylhydantoinase B|nr:hydantoinase B/oxoprolinase family protein [Alphaproteobacteria bacterium]